MSLASHKDMASQLSAHKEIKIERLTHLWVIGVTLTNFFMEAIVFLFGVAGVVPLLLSTKWRQPKFSFEYRWLACR